MRLTVTMYPHRGMLRVQADDATDYPPQRVALRVAEAAHRALHQLAAQAAAAPAEPDVDEHDQPDEPAGDVTEHTAAQDVPVVPQQRRAPDADHGPERAAAAGRDERVTRRRALRLLDQGHTVEEAAQRLGLDPDLIARWDDDAATDAHTDLLADAFGWPRPVEVAS